MPRKRSTWTRIAWFLIALALYVLSIGPAAWLSGFLIWNCGFDPERTHQKLLMSYSPVIAVASKSESMRNRLTAYLVLFSHDTKRLPLFQRRAGSP